MPASRRSFDLTSAFRERLRLLADRMEVFARQAWPNIEGLDATDFPRRMTTAVEQAQRDGVRLSAGYLAAYLTSETGKRPSALYIDPRPYVGISRYQTNLIDAMTSPIIATKIRLKRGDPFPQALDYGLQKAIRAVRFEAMQTPRDALIATVKKDDRFSDFQRAVAGTCAACEALSADGGPHFEVHPNCECVPQPVVSGVPQHFHLPTGIGLFHQKSKQEQDAAVGAAAAELIREGKADLKDFVGHDQQKHGPDFLTQRPVEDVAAN